MNTLLLPYRQGNIYSLLLSVVVGACGIALVQLDAMQALIFGCLFILLSMFLIVSVLNTPHNSVRIEVEKAAVEFLPPRWKKTSSLSPINIKEYTLVRMAVLGPAGMYSVSLTNNKGESALLLRCVYRDVAEDACKKISDFFGLKISA